MSDSNPSIKVDFSFVYWIVALAALHFHAIGALPLWLTVLACLPTAASLLIIAGLLISVLGVTVIAAIGFCIESLRQRK